MDIKLTPNESLSVIIEKYKVDLQKEIKKLRKELPKQPAIKLLKEKAKKLDNAIRKEVARFLDDKYPYLWTTMNNIWKYPFKHYEDWQSDTVYLDVDSTICVEIPTDLQFEGDSDDHKSYFVFRAEMPETDTIIGIRKEAESLSKPFLNAYEKIEDLLCKLKEAEKNLPAFRSEIKRKLLESTPEGKKILAELSKVNVAKALGYAAS